MDTQTFEKFRALIYEKSGISLGPQKNTLLSTRITKRIRALKLQSEGEYLNFILRDNTGDELVQLLDAISTNVTSFFREARHFELLTELLSHWRQQGATRFRIWCAASSTGEEPYCIAMTALEALGPTADFKLLATDISTRALSKAREGIYSEQRLEPVPRHLRTKYFEPADNGEPDEYRVRPVLRNAVSFNRLNLSTPPFPMRGPFDVVLCRNVMIYFDHRVRSALIGEIHRLLKPEGYLMVGHSENITSIDTPLKVVEPSVYRK